MASVDDPGTTVDESADNNTPIPVEGNTTTPVSVAGSLRINTAFLNDIAHSAAPFDGATGAAKSARRRLTAGAASIRRSGRQLRQRAARHPLHLR